MCEGLAVRDLYSRVVFKNREFRILQIPHTATITTAEKCNAISYVWSKSIIVVVKGNLVMKQHLTTPHPNYFSFLYLIHFLIILI